MDASQPAGWYPDPDQPSRERYWKGTEWSIMYRSGPGAAFTHKDGTPVGEKAAASKLNQPIKMNADAVVKLGFIAVLMIGGIWFFSSGGCSTSDIDAQADKTVACQNEIRGRAAPVSIDFGGFLDVPDVSGNLVTGTAKATVGGTKISFTYQCTVDSGGNVTDVSSDLPS